MCIVRLLISRARPAPLVDVVGAEEGDGDGDGEGDAGVAAKCVELGFCYSVFVGAEGWVITSGG